MAKAYDLKGKRFHSLVVIDRCNVKSPSGKIQWICECDCGSCLNVVTQHLVSGNTKTCGCGKVDRVRQLGKLNKKHGLTKSVEYKIWIGMKGRCFNPKYENYSNYGARGITVCERWRDSFELFIKDLGPRPSPVHSLDRIDPDGDYEPDNCRWATAEEQANNRRKNRKHEFNGQLLTIPQIARINGIAVATLESRIRRDGLSIEDAIAKVPKRHFIEYGGQTKRLNEWSEILNVPYFKLYRQVVTDGKTLGEVVKSTSS